MKFIVTIELYDEFVSNLLKESPLMYRYIHQLIKNSINMALIGRGKVLEIHLKQGKVTDIPKLKK